MSLCLLMPYPLQHLDRRREGAPWKQDEFDADREKIIQHFSRLGYRKITFGPTMFLGRWNGYITPSLRSACPGLFV